MYKKVSQFMHIVYTNAKLQTPDLSACSLCIRCAPRQRCGCEYKICLELLNERKPQFWPGWYSVCFTDSCVEINPAMDS